MDKFKQAVKRKNITISSEYIDSNPNMSDMPIGSTHYKCKLKKDGKQMTVYFSQGSVIKGKPDVSRVLSCLISDAGLVNNTDSIKAFADELGYSYLRAKKIYNLVKKQTKGLKNFLGSDFNYFMYEVENDY